MGGCATKPKLLKDEADAPQPTEEPNYPLRNKLEEETVAEATDARMCIISQEISAVVKENKDTESALDATEANAALQAEEKNTK
ncbi:hypothetical protein HPP92_011091 [Vanilla planifolia]|uniref:Uncharacterized protein n=1 Tax=Vanilla planifolia TaxID=51239 RepID=A0A835V2I1_VANPL|nr:hypothetical protein HPP92_011091 [Vanilla planifolia]